jgi:two-component system, LytTR family, response regulator
MITAIAIDDEPKAIKVIQHHISKTNGITLLSYFYNAKDALAFLKQNPVDLIFLDINMPNMSGMQMINELKLKPQLIFTTAYAEFAMDSYNFDAADYLLKPFDFERFQLALDKVEKRLFGSKHQNSFFFIKDGYKNIKIEFNDIQFVMGSGNYLDIITKDKKYVPRMTFTELIEKIPSSQFIRIHQSYIVNIGKIEKIENNHVYIMSHKIPISTRYKDLLLKRLGLI